MTHDLPPDPITRKLIDGLERLTLALQIERRRAAEANGLNPTQSSILRLLASREPRALRVGEIADHLGVRQPTATDSIAVLERKGLVTRRPSPEDSRVTLVALTTPASGSLSVARMAEAAIEDLTLAERGEMAVLLTKLIRSLQRQDAIPAQRLCVTCQHFRPNVHEGTDTPHHCALVDQAFGGIDLRFDCPEHLTAGDTEQASAWAAFTHP